MQLWALTEGGGGGGGTLVCHMVILRHSIKCRPFESKKWPCCPVGSELKKLTCATSLSFNSLCRTSHSACRRVDCMGLGAYYGLRFEQLQTVESIFHEQLTPYLSSPLSAQSCSECHFETCPHSHSPQHPVLTRCST